MSQAVGPKTNSQLKHRIMSWTPRLLGILLVVILLTRLDLEKVYQTFLHADLGLVAASILTLIPLILLKTIRWQVILGSQSIEYRLGPAFLAYFASLFIGFLTPGRLGEFVKAAYIHQDCHVAPGRALSSVLADRLFDLYALMIVGSAGLLTLTSDHAEILGLTISIALLTVPLALFLNNRTFSWLQQTGLRVGAWGRRLFAPQSWLLEMRLGLRQLAWNRTIVAILWTVLAYGVFFGQCYLLALALDLQVSYVQISFAVAIGSLVTLLPISISGLGTREAAIVAYLAASGVSGEPALSFSLLVFLTFYIASGLMGAIAWWVRPVALGQRVPEQNHETI
jgi:uncharacterized protein (TIRG00374 family)